MTRKKMIVVSIFILFIFTAILISIATITYAIISTNEKKYYNKANWEVTSGEFYDNYYPAIKEYFDNSIKESNVTFFEDIDNKYTYVFSYKNDSFQIKFIIEVFKNMCVFKCVSYFFYDSNSFNYDDIKFFDTIVSDFGEKAFYDYEIKDGIIFDIFEENINKNSYHYHFDRAVGYLGCEWYFSEGKELNSDAPYVLRIDICSLLRDSNDFINRIL